MKKKSLSESLRHIEQLEKRDAKKTEFFLAASHQLKAPVAIIQWCLQSLTENSEKLDNPTREMVMKALMQADAMSHLITDMLHIFRLTGRDRGKNFASVDVNALVDEVMAQYEVVAHREKVHLVKGPCQTVPPVWAEEAYLRQALINLVDNAIKYSKRDGQVIVSTHLSKDRFVEVKVADEGIGISEAEQTKLFSEFFRGVEAQEVAHDGTGLGLVLVKHVADELDGEVEVTSRLHKGSTFTLRIPVK